jgi:hypothetical protein
MMQYRIATGAHLKCPRHPLYHPRAGRAAIKGGCEACEYLLSVYRAYQRIQQQVSELERLADGFTRVAEKTLAAHTPRSLFAASTAPMPDFGPEPNYK